MSGCLSCECTNGRLKCKRTLQVNFPGKHFAYLPFTESCEQPGCNAVEFIKARRETCKGTCQVKELNFFKFKPRATLEITSTKLGYTIRIRLIDPYLTEKSYSVLTREEIEIAGKTFGTGNLRNWSLFIPWREGWENFGWATIEFT